MSITRRTAFTQLALAGFISALLARRAEAQTYTYDALGRVVSVEHNGSTVTYTYDDAGNRTQVVRASSPPSPPPPLPPPPPVPPPTFTQTIQITGASSVNLRNLANVAGYSDQQNATITFEVSNGVTITGAANGGTAIDTGLWPTGSKTVALTLTVKNGGKVRGGGGYGGNGGYPGGPNGTPGTKGGDAIFCRAPITINFNSGSEVRGGGGGGGGASLAEDGWPEPQTYSGGGGGGGAPNGIGGQGGTGGDFSGGNGGNGSTSGGGSGGASSVAPGAAGGGYGQNGGLGQSWIMPPATGGTGGVAGYCVRKNGFTVPVTNNGTTSGTIG